ncbi:MAG: hypothetical protein JO125_13090 [Chloroflexi bacterium]|nr:hypothetical protein [Ktedonobacteraceae bacterium]MBV8821899.1 hypothetical protein [Ktedonobacteraceae bacterium]MBV9020024.1 hypothetical protein [Ktedonobacteraceae bacterium]MBV9708333.1 hypothetical protein [Chloroflexota bacterium]
MLKTPILLIGDGKERVIRVTKVMLLWKYLLWRHFTVFQSVFRHLLTWKG